MLDLFLPTQHKKKKSLQTPRQKLMGNFNIYGHTIKNIRLHSASNLQEIKTVSVLKIKFFRQYKRE